MALSLGIVGLGMAVTPHAKALLDLSGRVRVGAAFSPSAGRRAAFGQRFSFPLVDSIDAVIKDPAIDAVLVLTPPNTHLDIVRACAAAKKHVLLEKPLDISTARAEALVAACEAAGVTLGIVLQHRFKPAAETAARLIRAGDLGDLVSCSTQIRLWRPQSYYDEPGRGTYARDGGGVLITQGIHTLDLMLSLTGPISEVSGFATTSRVHRMESEDLVGAAVRYANGAIGVIDATTSAYPGFPERIELVFRHATLVLAGSALDVYYHDGCRHHVAPDQSAGGTGADPMAFPHDYHRGVITDFVDAVQETRAPRISGRDGLAVHRLIDALIAAGDSNGPIKVA